MILFIKDEFEKLIKNDIFAEFGIVRGEYYGAAIEDCIDNQILIVNEEGFNQLISKNISLISFYIDASEETRKARMINRGDRLDDVENQLIYDRETFATAK